MIDYLSQILQQSWASALNTVWSLVPLALFFLFLGMLVKRSAIFTDMRRAASETGLNLQIALLDLVLIVPLIVVASQFLSNVFGTRGWSLVDRGLWVGMPLLPVMVLGVVVGDFVGYWRHRLEHTRFLWPSHAVHHSDTQMTWITLLRFHPINRVSTFLVDTSILLLIGLPVEAIIANNMVRNYYGHFIHADLPWTYGPLGRIFVSPAMHRWHHAADKAAFDTNYATVFSLWDQIFGTYRVPGPCNVPLGVTDKMQPTLSGQLGYAFSKRAYRRPAAATGAKADRTVSGNAPEA